MFLSSCYPIRRVGLLQERDDLPQYDSVAYEPYRLQVNDEIIYRVVTMDETIAKTLSANNNGSGQYANSYRIYSDGTVDIPFLAPVKLYDSGISGTAILLSQITPECWTLSIFLLILNIYRQHPLKSGFYDRLL